MTEPRHVLDRSAGVGVTAPEGGLPLDQADSSLRPHRPQASSPASRYRRARWAAARPCPGRR
jgi:hypothetical protein